MRPCHQKSAPCWCEHWIWAAFPMNWCKNTLSTNHVSPLAVRSTWGCWVSVTSSQWCQFTAQLILINRSESGSGSGEGCTPTEEGLRLEWGLLWERCGYWQKAFLLSSTEQLVVLEKGKGKKAWITKCSSRQEESWPTSVPLQQLRRHRHFSQNMNTSYTVFLWCNQFYSHLIPPYVKGIIRHLILMCDASTRVLILYLRSLYLQRRTQPFTLWRNKDRTDSRTCTFLVGLLNHWTKKSNVYSALHSSYAIF